MTGLMAAVAGGAVVVGVWLVVLGGRATAVRSPRRPPRRRSVPRPGWARWRWVVAGAAGLLALAVTRWVAGVLVAVAVVGLPLLLGAGAATGRRIARVEAVEEWTRRLADVLVAGVGLEQALTATVRTCPPPLLEEVGALAARLSARWPTEEALEQFADDVDDASADLVVAALVLASRRRGPGLARLLTGVADSVAEDVAVRRKIEAERAKPRTTARAVTLITIGVVAVGALNGTYLAPYGTLVGQLVLALIAGGFIGCLLWMRALTVSPPEPRFVTRREVAR